MISAIILAAGESRRMGQPKMLLPWGSRTVIEHVVTTFLRAGVGDVVVVTGAGREQVQKVLSDYPIRAVYNTDYATGEMLSSLQCGIAEMEEGTRAALIALGDQPQVEVSSVRRICQVYEETHSQLVVPSYDRRRGHPWLAARPLWKEILGLQQPETLRDFLNVHADAIHYVDLPTPAILADLDTPDDYQKYRP